MSLERNLYRKFVSEYDQKVIDYMRSLGYKLKG